MASSVSADKPFDAVAFASLMTPLLDPALTANGIPYKLHHAQPLLDVDLDEAPKFDFDRRKVDRWVDSLSQLTLLTGLVLRDRHINEENREDPRLSYWSPRTCAIEGRHIKSLSRCDHLKVLHLSNCGKLDMNAFKCFSNFKNLKRLELCGFTVNQPLLSTKEGAFCYEKLREVGACLNACPKLECLVIEVLHSGAPAMPLGYVGYMKLDPVALLERLSLKSDLLTMKLYYYTDVKPVTPLFTMYQFMRAHPRLLSLAYGNAVDQALQASVSPTEINIAQATREEHAEAEQQIHAFITLVSKLPNEMGWESLQKQLDDSLADAYEDLIFERTEGLARSRGIAIPEGDDPGKALFFSSKELSAKDKVDLILKPIAEEIKKLKHLAALYKEAPQEGKLEAKADAGGKERKE